MNRIDGAEVFAADRHVAPGETGDAPFAQEEWQVILLARKDGLSSLREPHPLSRLLAWALGGRADRRLANPRLEALRRLAVHAWHRGYQVPVSAMKAFKAEGFSADQMEWLLARIAGMRQSVARR